MGSAGAEARPDSALETVTMPLVDLLPWDWALLGSALLEDMGCGRGAVFGPASGARADLRVGSETGDQVPAGGKGGVGGSGGASGGDRGPWEGPVVAKLLREMQWEGLWLRRGVAELPERRAALGRRKGDAEGATRLKRRRAREQAAFRGAAEQKAVWLTTALAARTTSSVWRRALRETVSLRRVVDAVVEQGMDVDAFSERTAALGRKEEAPTRWPSRC